MKHITVKAANRADFSGKWCAGRFFPGGQRIDLEVLDQEADFQVEKPSADGRGVKVEHDPKTSHEIDVKNATTGLMEKQRRPHPTRIGLKAYRELQADPLLSIFEGGQHSEELSQAALDAARKQASDLAGELVDQKAKVATLEDQVAKLKHALEAAEAALKEDKAKVESTPPAETTTTTAAEPPVDDKSKGKKGK